MENKKTEKPQNATRRLSTDANRPMPRANNSARADASSPKSIKAQAPKTSRPRVVTGSNEQKKATEAKAAEAKLKAARESEIKKQIIREEKERKKKVIKYKSQRFLAFITLVGMAFLVMSILFASVFFINLFAHKNPDVTDYRLVLSDYDTKLEVKAGYVVGEDGKRYVNFSQIAEFYGFAMVGSIDDMKYIIKGDESETISFAVGSDVAVINTVKVKMPGKAFYKGGDLYVNEQFISSYINGFDITSNTKEKIYSVSRIMFNPVDPEGKITDGKPASYADISFKLKAPVVSTSIAEDDTAVVMPTFDFNSDLSEYEEYMNPGSTTEFLTLVNETHKLSEDYIPTGLSLLDLGSGMYLKEYAAMSFKAMYKEASACGVTGITVTKAYVSYDELEKEYNDTVDKYTPLLGAQQAKRYAAATVSTPGHDEHQTGLTLDIGMTNGAEFTNSMAYAWFCANSYKFGFVQRYPADKSDVTGVATSMSQFRYVGRYHAVRMNALGLSLDEYVEYLGL